MMAPLNEDLAELIDQARQRGMSPEEWEIQRRSHAIGEMMLQNPDMTRAGAESLYMRSRGIWTVQTDSRPAHGGWIPGSYECRCSSCSGKFFGHKRAFACADCAYAEPDQPPAPKISLAERVARAIDPMAWAFIDAAADDHPAKAMTQRRTIEAAERAIAVMMAYNMDRA